METGVLRLHRNKTIYDTHDLAMAEIAELELADGQPGIASYYADAEKTTVRTILAIGRGGDRTIFDIETIDKNIENIVTELKSSKYKVVAAVPSSENILNAYKLIDGDGKDITDSLTIEIPKDKNLHEVYLGKEGDTVDAQTGVVAKNTEASAKDSLNFVYQLADGTYSLVSIDVADFLKEAEFADADFDINGGNVALKRDVVKSITINGVDATMATGDTNDHKLTVTINGSDITVDGTSTTKISEKLEELVSKFDVDNGMFGNGLKYNETSKKYDVTIADALANTLQVTADGITWVENPVIDCGTYGE